MAYLEFNKAELVNLEYSLFREILLTNRAGGYVNTTIVGCNTRKYHGLLVVPIKNFGNQKHILLQSLQESLIQHEKVFNLGIASYGDVYEPRGHKYIVDFEMNYTSTILYRVGGMLFSKTIMFLRESEEVLIKYTLLEAHSPTTLRLKPFLAFRNIHSLTKENNDANTKYVNADNGVAFNMYNGFPTLHLQLNKKNEWIASPDWYKNVFYSEEARRGFECREDLFVPGYFEVPIKKGESIIFSASTKEVKSASLKSRFDKEVAKRDNTRNNYDEALSLAANQFIIKQDNEYSICSGYSWDYDNLRDSLISLAGLTIYNGWSSDSFENILDSILKKYKRLLTGPSLCPDAPLWLFKTLQEYIAWGGSKEGVYKKYGKTLKSILKSYIDGKRDEVFLHENGLLWAEKQGKALSWMNTYVDGKPVTERKGYQVELNALWYNALVFYAQLEHNFGSDKIARKYDEIATNLKNNFDDIFWLKEHKYYADFVNENGANTDVRPNQLIASALEFSPVDDLEKVAVFNKIKKELLTARGIRTLSPKSAYYKGVYEGGQVNRDLAHFNGCAMPWLLGMFIS